MAKFKVTLGRLVRETATVIVSAPSEEALKGRLNEVYDEYDGTKWEADTEWGCERSDTNFVDGPAPRNAKVDVTLS